MENKNQHHNSFGNGFVLGLLLGVVITLIITTKKGRELFKEFTEKGLDKFSDLEKKLQETGAELEENDEEDDYIPAEEAPEVKQLASRDKRIFTEPVDLDAKEEKSEQR